MRRPPLFILLLAPRFHTLQRSDEASIAIASATSSRSTYPWNSRLRELAKGGLHLQVLALFRVMLLPSNPRPDAFSLPSAIHSAAALSLRSAVSSFHCLAIKNGSYPGDPFVLSSLLSAYSRLSLLPLADVVLRQISGLGSLTPVPTLVVCYNSVISGHVFPSEEAVSLFIHMRRSDLPFNSITLLALIPVSPPASVPLLHAVATVSGFGSVSAVANCLITAYSKTGDVDLACRVFDEMPDPRELISWNALISAYAQNGVAHGVLDLFERMERSGETEPDPVTLVCVLSSCANLGAKGVGLKIERIIEKHESFSSNVFLKNAMINFHARCGDLSRAGEIFDGMPKKSLISWTAMISGYGMHGHGDIALNLFERMLSEGFRPDGVLMVSVLSACSHSGLYKRGMQYFSSMKSFYGVLPRAEHYACMVDLMGRAGRLKDALELIHSMPVEPDGAVWGALLAACKVHKNVELGEMAFERVAQLEPTNVGYYVLLSNIYLDAGRLDGVARIRGLLQADEIYQMIARLEWLVREEEHLEERSWL